MPNILDQQFGLYSKALEVHSKRNELIAENLANADTPGFKSRDLDFKSVMQGVQDQNQTLALSKTNGSHLGTTSSNSIDGMMLKYRNPLHPSLDGNTVDTQMETTAYAENAVRYQATLSFMNSRIVGLINAFKGE